MNIILGLLSLLMQMRKNDSNKSHDETARQMFRDYWLDPEYSYQRSDSKELFGSGFDFRV